MNKQTSESASKTETKSTNSSQKKTQNTLIWIVLFFPVGIYLMLRRKNFSKEIRGIVMLIVTISFIGIVFQDPKPSKISDQKSLAVDRMTEIKRSTAIAKSELTSTLSSKIQRRIHAENKSLEPLRVLTSLQQATYIEQNIEWMKEMDGLFSKGTLYVNNRDVRNLKILEKTIFEGFDEQPFPPNGATPTAGRLQNLATDTGSSMFAAHSGIKKIIAALTEKNSLKRDHLLASAKRYFDESLTRINAVKKLSETELKLTNQQKL